MIVYLVAHIWCHGGPSQQPTTISIFLQPSTLIVNSFTYLSSVKGGRWLLAVSQARGIIQLSWTYFCFELPSVLLRKKNWKFRHKYNEYHYTRFDIYRWWWWWM